MLKTLHLSALRGATQPLTIDFEKKKKITIIYGDNGTGKSTICDALEFLSEGTVGSLEERGLGRSERYWHSTGKRPVDLVVKLSTDHGEWEGRLNKSKPAIVPDSPRPRVEILRRSQILKLITQQASKRYDAIRPFIELEGIEKAEASLRGLIKTENDKLTEAATRLGENRTTLEDCWLEMGSPGTSALDWARAEIARDRTQLDRESLQLRKLIGACDRLLEEDRRRLEEAAKSEKAESDLVSARTKLQQEQARISTETGELVGLLQAARSYFQAHPEPDHCPLCGSGEFADGLPDRIEGQLDSIRSLETAIKQQQAAEQSATLARKQLEQQSARLHEATLALAELLGSLPAISGLAVPSDLESAIQNIMAGRAEAVEQSRLIARIGELLATTREASQKREQQVGFLNQLRKAVENYEANYRSHQESDALLPRIQEALSLVEQTRRQFVDDILREISQRVGELYEEIHPGEGLEKIRLLLDPDKRASLDIQSDFPFAGEAPPGAYFSESHLDTLGLCIWLALAERGGAAQKIIVLDDVIGSVDEQHSERTIELLYRVSQNFQHCILTTHYRPWREKYRWGWLRNGQCHFVELADWEHASGIRHGECRAPIGELRNLLDARSPSPQAICAGAGVILEAILDFLTLKYECAVPRKKSKYTLNDLLPNIKSKLRASLRIERAVRDGDGKIIDYESHDLGPLLDELDNLVQLRNVMGCHFNDLAHHLPPNDAVQFGEKVHRLASLLIDEEAGWPMSDKSGSYWTNSDGTVRLHPLKQPK